MIKAAHTIVYSADAEADRAFFRDVLGWKHVDVGHGWLIFEMPPSGLAFHPAETNGKHELYFICDSMQEFLAEMKRLGVETAPIHEEMWGSLTSITLPGGGKIGVYEAKHALASES
ncbi:MAG: extradiol dioxygenase [Proteobacteria bacterium]|nr:extradiol dioxygenase [Pseudomonadota bacterium]MCP4918698.1 extradiol dioxygenase [Pseudomonadota bacterium]